MAFPPSTTTPDDSEIFPARIFAPHMSKCSSSKKRDKLYINDRAPRLAKNLPRNHNEY